MHVNFFRKCGITLILSLIIMILFCIEGCLEKTPEISQMPSAPQEDQRINQSLQMDFDAELRSDLFDLRGNIMLPGNSSLAYLMLNATLHRGEKRQFSTKYLLIQVEPNRDYGFEIAKNVKIPAGEYDCTLEAIGPQGVLAEESRKVSLAQSRQELSFKQVPWPVELDEEFSEERTEEAQPKEESIVQKEIKTDAEEEEDRVAMASEVSGSALSKDANATFMGSIASKKYHRLDCRYALKIKQENRINFRDREDAERQGYTPCKVCNP